MTQKLLIRAVLIAFICGSFTVSSYGQEAAANRGTVRISGVPQQVGPSFTATYQVGGGFGEFRNFFDWNLNTLSSQWATAASVTLTAGTGNTGSDPDYMVFDLNSVNEMNMTTLFNDAGMGTQYMDAVVSIGAGNANLTLNTAALAAINAAAGAGTNFSLGGALQTNITSFRFGTTGSSPATLTLTPVANVAPTGGTDDYVYFLSGGITLDAQLGTLSDDADIVPYGDSLVSYDWTVNNFDMGDFGFLTSSSDELMLSDAQLAMLGVATQGTYDVSVEVTDEWGATGSGSGFLVTVPEPNTMSLLCLGAIGLVAGRKRRR